MKINTRLYRVSLGQLAECMPNVRACGRCLALHRVRVSANVKPYILPQVVDKSPDAVLDEVEAAIFTVANSILTGNGFSYSVPSRAKGNQLCVPAHFLDWQRSLAHL